MGTLVLNGATTGSTTLTPTDNVTATITLPSATTATLAILGANTFTGVQAFPAGAVGAPAIYLSTDATTGLYRIGANNYGVAVSGAKVLDIASTGLAVTGALSSTTTITATTSVDITGSNGARSLFIRTGAIQSFYDSTNTEQARIQATGSGMSITANTGGGSLAIAGNTAITGSLSKSSGTFKIDHPLAALTDTHHLVHSFIEGPQADLIYRGKATLVGGKATVNIDAAATMTEGTFDVLCQDVQCFTTNESDWTPVRGAVEGNILTIESQDPAATSSISWMVIGERKDKHMMETDWTDDNGKVIVEPVKLEAK